MIQNIQIFNFNNSNNKHPQYVYFVKQEQDFIILTFIIKFNEYEK